MKNIKLGKFSKVVMALAMIAPVVAPAVGSVVAAEEYTKDYNNIPEIYYRRDPTTNAVPTFPGYIDDQGNRIAFNRPVYRNDPRNNDGYDDTTKKSSFSTTMVYRDALNDLYKANFISSQLDRGAYLYRNSGKMDKAYNKPNMQLIYTYRVNENLIKSDPINQPNKYKDELKELEDADRHLKHRSLFKPVGNHWDFSQVEKISDFLTKPLNFNIDYNKDGQLELQYRYSVKVDSSLVSGLNASKLINTIKKNGLGFNAFVRVPDGYKSKNVVDAVVKKDPEHPRYSQLLLNPTESTIKNDTILMWWKWQNTLHGFNVVSSNLDSKYKALQVVDDHLLKFSVNSATNSAYKETIQSWIDANAKTPAFITLIEQDLPIQLQMLLTMNEMAKDGDQFDPYGNSKILTKGRKLPAIDNRTAINATFLSSDKIFKVQTADDKFAFFPTYLQSDIDSFNNYGGGKSNDGYKKNDGPQVRDEYIDGTGFLNNVHPILRNDSIYNNETTISNNGVYDVTKEFNKEYMKSSSDLNGNPGNAIETWNQYISLYDKEYKYNTYNNPAEKVTRFAEDGQPKQDSKQLPMVDNDPYKRSVTLHTSDVDKDNKFDPMRFFRSVNYFTMQDTTKNMTYTDKNKEKKSSVTFVETGEDDELPQAYQGDNPTMMPGQPVELLHGQTKHIWYYGTDENGHPFSPVRLTVTRPDPDIEADVKVSTASILDKVEANDPSFKKELYAADGQTVTELDEFTLNTGSTSDNLGNISFKVQAPANAALKGESFKVFAKDPDTHEYTPIDSTVKEDGSIEISGDRHDGDRIAILYSYDIHGKQGDVISTKSNRLLYVYNNDGVKQEFQIEPHQTAEINILNPPAVRLVSVPESVSFGLQDAPNELKTFDDPEIKYPGDLKGIGIDYVSDGVIKNFRDWSLKCQLLTDGSEHDISKVGKLIPKVSADEIIKDRDGRAITSELKEFIKGDNEKLLPLEEHVTNYILPGLTFDFDANGRNIASGNYEGKILWTLSYEPSF